MTVMPMIHFRKKWASLKIRKGANLMSALIRHGKPVARSCHGEAVCGKCGIEILEGVENINPPSPLEQALLERESLPKNIRVSCQVQVFGDIRVDTEYW